MKVSVPGRIRDRVVRRLYQDAAVLDWQHVTDAERSRQYAAWLDDPEIGGSLSALLGREGARLWIKDGPLKEYARARAGAGPYARFVDSRSAGPEELARAALGSEWRVVDGTFAIKPLHCLAEREAERAYLAWGPARDFKHLLWASLKAVDRDGGRRAHIVVLESLERPTPSAARNEQLRIAQRCGVDVSHLAFGSAS